MSPKKDITETMKAEIFALFKEGLCQIEIARKVKCSINCIQTIIIRYNKLIPSKILMVKAGKVVQPEGRQAAKECISR